MFTFSHMYPENQPIISTYVSALSFAYSCIDITDLLFLPPTPHGFPGLRAAKLKRAQATPQGLTLKLGIHFSKNLAVIWETEQKYNCHLSTQYAS